MWARAGADVTPEENDAASRAALEQPALAGVELEPGQADDEHLAAEDGQGADHPLWSTSFRP
jgi:hypothetical protein